MCGVLSLGVASIAFITLLVGVGVHSASYSKKFSQKQSPVILIPGDGGSRLEAKLDKPNRVHVFCDKKTEKYFNLWLNPNLLVPGVVDCWVDNMRLVYNETTRSTSNSPGVDIRVPGFGNSSSVEWLYPSKTIPPYFQRVILSAYFVDIATELANMGYERGINIRGAPYDYRKAPNEMKEYYTALNNLVEETYEINSGVKVTLVCHSMGCPITSYFLNNKKQSWKDKYIKALISLGGAWGGAVKAMKVIASGENLGIMIVSQTTLRTEQRTGPSLAYMLPSRQLWPKDEILACTKTKNYTVSNYQEFFADINYPTAYEMYKDTQMHADVGLRPPGVEVHCLHGFDMPTPEKLNYTKPKSFPDKPELVLGNGDGTVNLRSLNACALWEGKQEQKVLHIPIKKLEHFEMLSNRTIIEYIATVVRTW